MDQLYSDSALGCTDEMYLYIGMHVRVYNTKLFKSYKNPAQSLFLLQKDI